jgi:hypothetical protein
MAWKPTKSPSLLLLRTKGAQWYLEQLPATYIAYGTHEVLLDGIRKFQGAFNGKELMVFEGEGEAHVFNVLEMRYSKTRQIWRNANESMVEWLGKFPVMA